MHEAKFINDWSAAIVEEPEYDHPVINVGGDVRIFSLSKVACFTVGEEGSYRVTLDGGETFYVTKEDFEMLATSTFGYNIEADDIWD